MKISDLQTGINASQQIHGQSGVHTSVKALETLKSLSSANEDKYCDAYTDTLQTEKSSLKLIQPNICDAVSKTRTGMSLQAEALGFRALIHRTQLEKIPSILKTGALVTGEKVPIPATYCSVTYGNTGKKGLPYLTD